MTAGKQCISPDILTDQSKPYCVAHLTRGNRNLLICTPKGKALKGVAPSKSAQPASWGASFAAAGGSGNAFQGSWLAAKGNLGGAPFVFPKPCTDQACDQDSQPASQLLE